MENNKITNGPAAAAVLAAGIGCFTIGLATDIAAASAAAAKLLTWCPPVGPLSGKTGVGVIVWLVSWVILHQAWREKDVAFQKTWITSAILIVLANVMVFPTFFDLLAPH